MKGTNSGDNGQQGQAGPLSEGQKAWNHFCRIVELEQQERALLESKKITSIGSFYDFFEELRLSPKTAEDMFAFDVNNQISTVTRANLRHAFSWLDDHDALIFDAAAFCSQFGESYKKEAHDAKKRKYAESLRPGLEKLTKFDPSLFHSQQQQQRPLMVQNVATFEKNVFYVDPHNGRMFSCCDVRVQRALETRGFRQTAVTHLAGGQDMVELPTLSIAAAAMTVEQTSTAAAPTNLTLPQNRKFPRLWIANGKSTAWGIVHAFEVKVYDAQANIIYSPYRFWTPEERKNAGLKSTAFTKYCQAYYVIRKVAERSPDLITDSIGTLTKMAANHACNVLRVVKPDWFFLAAEVAREQMGSRSASPDKLTRGRGRMRRPDYFANPEYVYRSHSLGLSCHERTLQSRRNRSDSPRRSKPSRSKRQRSPSYSSSSRSSSSSSSSSDSSSSSSSSSSDSEPEMDRQAEWS